MNLKTTLVLLILLVTGAFWFWLSPPLPSFLGGTPPSVDTAPRATLDILEHELTTAKLERIEVGQGSNRVLLTRGPQGDWTIAGQWLSRPREVQELVGTLTSLRSRFTPIRPGAAGLEPFGLDNPALTVIVTADRKSYRLKLGDDPRDSNRFTRATYLLLGEPDGKGGFIDRPEVVRLAPGVVAALDRPLDYYLQRRLFPSERVAKSTDDPEKIDKLVAGAVSVKGPTSSYGLEHKAGAWALKEPVRDRADPEKLRTVLAAVPDIWADHFVRNASKDLADYGLDKPEQSVTVQRNDGTTVTLLIGKESPRTEERKVTRQPPPGQPIPPMVETVFEKFRFAKLAGNDQVFEIKEDKLKDLFLPFGDLRDARLARYRGEDARRVEVKYKDVEIVLVRQDGKWQLEKPIAADAEAAKVTELLDQLSGLETRGAEINDQIDAKAQQLDPPAGTVAVTIEDETKNAAGETEKKQRTIKYSIGKHDADKKKVALRVDDWPRVNVVDDALVKLIDRPALAYRGRSVFDLAGKELEQIDVQRGDEKYTLKNVGKVGPRWELTTPVQAEADAAKASTLAGDLVGLNVAEYVAEEAKPEDLDKLYGLEKPALTVTLKTAGDKDAKSWTLRVGKQREGKPEYFAKLDSAPQVFAIKKETRDQLDQSALALRPLQLWQVPVNDVAALRIQKQDQPEYSLKREGMNWKVSGPFEAGVPAGSVEAMLGNLATVKSEKYEAQGVTDLAKYGLDKPALRIIVREADKDKEAGKEHTLLIGKPTAEGAKTHYARRGDSDAVVVVGEALVSAADRGALDLLDRSLLKLERERITKVVSTGGDGLTLAQQDSRWQATTPNATFPADPQTVAGVLAAWFNLRADRFAAYGKSDLAQYGLAKPAQTVTITAEATGEDGKPTGKSSTHKLALGKPVEGGQGERYARLDDSPAVVVLGGPAVSELTRGYLDFVDRTLLDIDMGTLTAVLRKMGEHELELVKRDDGWHLVKPEAQRADGPSLEKLLQQLSRLRAPRVAAFPAKDLKAFGLDDPAAVVTLRSTDGEGKTKDRIIKIGETADEAGKTTGDRYAIVEGGDKVAVLPGALVRQLVAKPLTFRDKALAKFTDADKVILERGPRKAVFALVDGNWKLTEPLAADADQAELEDFINAVARLRADELVAEKPEELKPYGLDRPTARWQFFSGGKEVLGLVIGDVESKVGEPARVYAQLAGGDTVVLLDPKLTTRVLGEYRSRKLWEPLDAFQVEGVEYGGEKPFALEKVDEKWRIAGKPDSILSSARVNETIAALANLKPERFIIDKDADFKLFGLDPPALTVDIKTRTGMKRSLQVGTREGDSKRWYARVIEGDRSDVFVLSEADSAKLVRDVAAFAEDKPK